MTTNLLNQTYLVVNSRLFIVDIELAYRVSKSLDIKIEPNKLDLTSAPIKNFPGPYGRAINSEQQLFNIANSSMTCKLEFRYFFDDIFSVGETDDVEYPLNYSILASQHEQSVPCILPGLKILQRIDYVKPKKYEAYFTINKEGLAAISYGVPFRITIAKLRYGISSLLKKEPIVYMAQESKQESTVSRVRGLYIEDMKITGYKPSKPIAEEGLDYV